MEIDSYILALDQGTTSSRAIVFNKSGNIVGSRQKALTQIFPQPGWVEHDPEEIWRTQIESAREAIDLAQITPSQIAAIGISNQRETTVIWDRATGKPVYNAIVWQCRRSSRICEELSALGFSDFIKERTGLIIDPYFSGTKLVWLFEEIPELKGRAERGEILFGTVDSWLIYNLTGVHATDATNASRTMLFNIHTGTWDDDILNLLHIPRAILPEVLPSSHIYGLTKKDLFGMEIPVAGAAGDQQAALFGHACFEPGSAKSTYGTGCFVLLNTGDRPITSRHNLLTTIAWDLGVGGYTYALEGSVFIAGAVVQWMRDQLGLIAESAETESLAKSVSDTGGVVMVPAFVGMGAPYWDSEMRGTIVGITRGTNRAHFVRAALESIAYQTNDLLDAMEKDFEKPINFIKADGGASANSFLMQFQSDILNRPVILPEVNEISALGAAYLAGLRVGYWADMAEIAQNWRRRREFRPDIGREKREGLIDAWRKAVGAASLFK